MTAFFCLMSVLFTQVSEVPLRFQATDQGHEVVAGLLTVPVKPPCVAAIVETDPGSATVPMRPDAVVPLMPRVPVSPERVVGLITRSEPGASDNRPSN